MGDIYKRTHAHLCTYTHVAERDDAVYMFDFDEPYKQFGNLTLQNTAI